MIFQFRNVISTFIIINGLQHSTEVKVKVLKPIINSIKVMKNPIAGIKIPMLLSTRPLRSLAAVDNPQRDGVPQIYYVSSISKN